MKNKITLLLAISVAGIIQAQVGFNTSTPKATLDIVAKTATGTSTAPEGLLVPRVDRQKAQSMTGITASTMIYVNSIATGAAAGTAININAVGYYYFDGTAWIKINTGNSADTNIYNTNGNLGGNRTVNQVGNTLAFTSTATTGRNHFSVDAVNNRVGVGTATPETAIDINAAGAGFQHTNGTIKLRSYLGTDYASFGTITNQRLSFVTNNGYRMTIAADGKVGINTQTPNNLLDLGGGNGKKLAIWNSAAGDDFYGFGAAQNVLQLFAGVPTDGNALMTLNKNGNVGIGTTSPQTNFHIVGTRRFENSTTGSVATGSVLTATDANGTAEWKTPVAEAVVGDLTGGGIDIPFATNGDYKYTGRYITLPPGRWAVTITQLAQTLGVLDTDDWMFVRSTFTDQNVAVGAVATRSGAVNGGPSLMSFRVQGPASAGALQQFDVYQGAVFINNTSGANKTYRYIVGATVVGGGPNASTAIKSFGGSWSESSIYATAIK